MIIEKNQNGRGRTIAPTGRLDTTQAPKLKATLPGIEHLVLDFTKLDYLSSAGLRILPGAQKQMTDRAICLFASII